MAQFGMSHGARRAAALVSAACLVASCSTAGTRNGGAGPRATPSTSSGHTTAQGPSAGAGPDQVLGTLPAGNASALAAQLNRATATLRGKNATWSDIRKAAEFQQLAVHALVVAPTAFFRRVANLLDPGTAQDIRSDVRAGRLLHSMSEPQRGLPHWRIVAPPPAAELLGDYKRAQRRTGVPWTYLAAINLVETRMGRIRGTSTAGARGPMQFLPSTWHEYGAGGDINDPRDAILAAARLLKRHGAPGDMTDALWHFNHSAGYVGAVREYARTMHRSASAYRGYWYWRVLYRNVRRTYMLPVGYPGIRPVALPGTSSPVSAARGTVPPPWLGKRRLPRTKDGYAAVRRTPWVMRVRRWNTRDTIPALPGTGFKAVVADPAPRRVIARSSWRPGCPVGRTDLAWTRMTYWGFDGTRHSGEMLVNGSVAGDVVHVFRRLYRARFPIESMGIARRADLHAPPTGDGNVTGSFACRSIRGGTSYSQHAYGLAVDLNPFQNPYRRGHVVLPQLASAYLDRSWLRPGMITPGGRAVRAFASIGWKWGGDWSGLKDYQHFSANGR